MIKVVEDKKCSWFTLRAEKSDGIYMIKDSNNV